MTQLKPELKSQIEKEADELYPFDRSKYQPHVYSRGDKADFESQAYVTGATAYALKWQQAEERISQLEQWKKEATMLLDPLLDWGHAQKDIPPGTDVITEILRRAKMYKEAEEMIEKMALLLKRASKTIDELQFYAGTGSNLIRDDIDLQLNECNNYKQLKDGTVDR